MKDLKRQLVSERRRAEKLQDRLQEVLSDSRNTCTKSRSRGFQCQTIVIWYYDHFVPKDISYRNGHNDSFVICTIKNLYLHHYYKQGNLIKYFLKYLCAWRSENMFYCNFFFITRCWGFIGWKRWQWISGQKVCILL